MHIPARDDRLGLPLDLDVAEQEGYVGRGGPYDRGLEAPPCVTLLREVVAQRLERLLASHPEGQRRLGKHARVRRTTVHEVVSAIGARHLPMPLPRNEARLAGGAAKCPDRIV